MLLKEGFDVVFSNGNHVMCALQVQQNKIQRWCVCGYRHQSNQQHRDYLLSLSQSLTLNFLLPETVFCYPNSLDQGLFSLQHNGKHLEISQTGISVPQCLLPCDNRANKNRQQLAVRPPDYAFNSFFSSAIFICACFFSIKGII